MKVKTMTSLLPLSPIRHAVQDQVLKPNAASMTQPHIIASKSWTLEVTYSQKRLLFSPLLWEEFRQTLGFGVLVVVMDSAAE